MSGLIKSWIESANLQNGNFPLNNLPFGVYSLGEGSRKCCVAIGSYVLNLDELEFSQLIVTNGSLREPTLNNFMAEGKEVWSSVRLRLIELLREGGDNALRHNDDLRDRAFHRQEDVQMHLPFEVAEYTDFFAGRNHATNVGTMFRGAENALPPNWLHIPIGYNGRASTVVVSGTDIIRPHGQLKSPEFDKPVFAPSRRLDIELEMGAVVGTASAMGKRVSVAEADDMIFGYVILNDWSARDIQAWEYQPLGPFQAKATATSIGPWVVTKEALEPFRVDTPEREFELLDYLKDDGPALYNIDLEISVVPKASGQETVVSRTNYREMYYSSAQQLAHHSSSGCAMNTGDLLGSGTISGSTSDSYGSLLELSWGGKTPVDLQDGSTRTFIEDGDEWILKGHAQGDGFRIGFGHCSGRILPAE